MQVTTRIIDGCKRRNSYYIANPQTDFYFVEPILYKEPPAENCGLSALIKGYMS